MFAVSTERDVNNDYNCNKTSNDHRHWCGEITKELPEQDMQEVQNKNERYGNAVICAYVYADNITLLLEAFLIWSRALFNP